MHQKHENVIQYKESEWWLHNLGRVISVNGGIFINLDIFKVRGLSTYINLPHFVHLLLPPSIPSQQMAFFAVDN